MPDSKTQRLISKWQISVNAVKQAEDDLQAALSTLSNSSAQLGSWLVPDDANLSEVFNIWVNGQLLMVRVLIGKNNYDIGYRPERKKSGEEQ
jgi:hypothetical protein